MPRKRARAAATWRWLAPLALRVEAPEVIELRIRQLVNKAYPFSREVISRADAEATLAHENAAEGAG